MINPPELELLWAKMTVPHLSRHGVGADKKTSYKLTDKVDRHGNYLEFPNLTVVHPLRTMATRTTPLANLPLCLQQIAGVFLSPLPSYHATLLCGPLHIDLNHYYSNDGTTAQQQQQQQNLFAQCLSEPCWERMAQYLASKQYAPVNLTLGEVVCKASGGVTVYLQETTQTTMKGDDNENYVAAEQIRQELREIGVCSDNNNNLQQSLQQLLLTGSKGLGKKAVRTVNRLLTCLMEPKDRAWHITIAYPRKSAGGPMPEEVQEQVRTLVRDAFLQTTYDNDGILSFEPAQLCLSPDMTTFVRWNGKPPVAELQYFRRPKRRRGNSW
eukprot:CAMPEP_0113624774 /NCGR_PEP_ID=MMETSP0017_2-20120614/12782_1 /TAXON_ID=2856 /ORGANISM="Cylindrotheca closterium" /LENGTH=325 /DNA_ID=CAMNT_0000534837 /DNA_START=453 /DNA_END=1430 /DNA_ORIENTATION=+ /assembly_acc=CAM_ASM_000147